MTTLALAERIAAMPRFGAGAGQAGGEPVRGPDGDARRAWTRCSACITSRTRTTPRCPATRWPAWTPAMKKARRMEPRSGRRCVPGRGAGLAARARAGPRLPPVDTRGGVRAHRAWERELAAARLSVVSWPRRVRGPRRPPAGVAGLRGGVLRAPARRPGRPERPVPAGPRPCSRTVPPSSGTGCCRRWPARTRSGRRRGQNRTRAATWPRSAPRHPCTDGGWLLSGHEDLELAGGVRGPGVRPVPHRPGARSGTAA